MYYLLLNHLVFINACIFETLRLEMSKNVERLQNIFLDHPFNEITTKLYLVTKEKFARAFNQICQYLGHGQRQWGNALK